MSYNRLGYSYTSLYGGTGPTGGNIAYSDSGGLFSTVGQLIIGNYGVYMITSQVNIVYNHTSTIYDKNIVISQYPGGTGASNGNTAGGVPLTPYGFVFYNQIDDAVSVKGIRDTQTISGVFTVNSGLTGTGAIGDTGYGFPIYVNASCYADDDVLIRGGISATRIA
jgi:hypothetical protein